jgi:hypothetical protein
MRRTWSIIVCGALVSSILACSSSKSSEEAEAEAQIAKLNEAEAAKEAAAAEQAAPKEEVFVEEPAQDEGDDEPEYTKGGELIVREPSKGVKGGSDVKGGSNAALVKGTLVGKIIKKPWSKSGESWRAGGSEYYVLDVGGAQVEERTAEVGVILRASDAVSMEQIAAAAGSEVEVSGVYVPDMPYEPQNPGEQYPMGMDGKPVPRGGGFKVTILNKR